MDFENARWVKLYCQDTGTWLRLGWQGRTVALHLLRSVNSSGVLSDLGTEPELILSELLRLPPEVVTPGLAALVRTGTVTLGGGILVWTAFVDAQRSRKSETQRKAEYRAKHRQEAISGQSGTSCPESGTESPGTVSECPECPTTSGQKVPEEKRIERRELKRKDSLVDSDPSQPELELEPQLAADTSTGFALVPANATPAPKVPSKAQIQAQVALGLFAELVAARMSVIAGAEQLQPRPAALAGLKACLGQGYTPEQIRHVIKLKAAEVRADPGQAKWFVPTWFRPANVERYCALREVDVTSGRCGFRGGPPKTPADIKREAELDAYFARQDRKHDAIEVASEETRRDF